jgi:formylglycine-generating enzyme required for sulfatase activity
VCIGFDDARAYAAWLSAKTGHRYRLLSEAEYEYVARAGTISPYWWGNELSTACGNANGRDLDAAAAWPGPMTTGCRDGAVFTSDAGTTKPNAFGLFDIVGNVGSWTADCWRADLRQTPVDGTPSQRGNCRYRVVRGTSWADPQPYSATRTRADVRTTSSAQGFRLAREL